LGLTIKELLPVGEKTLKDAGVENYKIDAEALLGFVSGMDKKDLFLNQDSDVSDSLIYKYFALLSRRKIGEPLQYITGEQYFMGHRFAVDTSVLIPRPETEILAEKAIEYLKSNCDANSVLDLCTGSGALAISIALACPNVKVAASDVSAAALAVAKQNAIDLGISGRIDFIESDLFAAFGHMNKFDLIVTNPPYIRSEDLSGLTREIKDHEPLSALDGGPDGLDFYKRIATDARTYMNNDACMMTEIGADQACDVTAIFTESGFTIIGIFRDYNDLDRVLMVSGRCT